MSAIQVFWGILIKTALLMVVLKRTTMKFSKYLTKGWLIFRFNLKEFFEWIYRKIKLCVTKIFRAVFGVLMDCKFWMIFFKFTPIPCHKSHKSHHSQTSNFCSPFVHKLFSQTSFTSIPHFAYLNKKKNEKEKF